jgi:hypothetical protein
MEQGAGTGNLSYVPSSASVPRIESPGDPGLERGPPSQVGLLWIDVRQSRGVILATGLYPRRRTVQNVGGHR